MGSRRCWGGDQVRPSGPSCEQPQGLEEETVRRWRRGMALGLGVEDAVRDDHPLRVRVVAASVVPRSQVACEGRMDKTIR
jgi:hypothetical protein